MLGDKLHLLRKLWSGHLGTVLRARWRLSARFAVTLIGQTVTSLSMVLMIKEFLAGALGEAEGLGRRLAELFGGPVALAVVASLLFASYLLESWLRYDNKVTQQRIVKVVELSLMRRLIDHLLTLSVPFFDNHSSGDVLQAVRHDVTHLRHVITALGGMLLESFVALGLILGAFLVSPELAVLGLLVLPMVLLPIMLIGKRTRAHSLKVRSTGFSLLDTVLEILGGIRVIKAFRTEAMQSRISVERASKHFDSLVDIVKTSAKADLFLQSAAGLGTAAVILMGGLRVGSGAMTWTSLLAFLMAFRALHGPVANTTKLYVQAETHSAAVRRIDELLRLEPDIEDGPDAQPLPQAPRRIQLDDVGLAMNGRTLLHSVSLTARAGETLGIVGPSGAGKTTLLNLLVRFYDPTRGSVRFDGVDLRQIRLDDLYARVAIVLQQPFLFAASVRDNIRCGRPSATDAEVEEAARAAHIHDAIQALPAGYDTQIGLGGAGLSLGQEQRINIARALLKNADVLLFDEATSALDSVAEAAVQSAIDALMEHRTTFIIAHRLSTLRRADRILVIDQGRQVGFGTHEQLLATCDVYRQSWAAQALPDSVQTAV
ncbi:MAG: ABC transporter ATP-binding protein [Acidobacteriota bacterium]